MKRLILLRHAEAAQTQRGKGDRDRNLTPLGLDQAKNIGSELRTLGWIPEIAIVSDAIRGRETLEELMSGGHFSPEIHFSPSFYLGAITEIITEVSAFTSDDHSTVLVIGHNPGWSDAVLSLTGQPLLLSPANAALLSHPGNIWRLAIGELGRWKLDNVAR